jgi:hypothetical protein
MKAIIQPICDPRNLTVLYRIVVQVIDVTLIVTFTTDDLFPKASRPNGSFSRRDALRFPALRATGYGLSAVSFQLSAKRTARFFRLAVILSSFRGID